MTIVAMDEMLRHAYANGYAVPSFEINSLEILLGVISAAEQNHSPVILAVTEEQLDKVNFAVLMPSIENAARQATVPVAIQLHDATSLESAVRAINAGCNAVMIDTRHLSIDNNVVLTHKIAEMAHACGVTVEGGLNSLPDINMAISYVGQTTVDSLNITSNVIYAYKTHESMLDDYDLTALREQLSIPLVIRSGFGLSEEQFYPLISNGVSKINFGAVLNDAVDTWIRFNIEDSEIGYAELMQSLQDIVSGEVEACIQVCQSGGQADNILNHCTHWLPVEHVIHFNVSGINGQQAEAMMAEGRQSLRTIPGVRKVITARAVKEDAQYRFSWLIRFCHPAVIDSYRDHPLHVAFADKLFRPVAGDRISIDYQWNVA